MGGGPASADVVRSSCFVTFPEQTRAEPVPVDAWYLFAAGLTFLRRLARDRVGDEMRIALLLQEPGDEAGERRYVSVSSNAVLQRALQETFDCPDRALVLHVVDVAKVRGQKRIHVRPEVNPNVSPEPVEPMGLVFPTLSVDGLAAPTAVEVPAAQVTSESLYEQMSRSMFNYRKDDSVRWGAASSGGLEKPQKALSQSAFFVEERDYTRKGARKGEQEQQEHQEQQEVEERTQRAGVPVAVQAVADLLPAAKQVDNNNTAQQQEEEGEEQVDESEIPVATVVEADTTQIPSDYVMLELQTGAGLPAAPANASSTYFISSRWAEQADEMSASMRLERPPLPRATPVRAASSVGSIRANANLEDSFVILERHEL
ncbi:Zinc (Zn2)-Iron (Fe2) Permease (ZIP) family [Phytophthora cinnamomi]|uniref:Zinc (Zn2)-Iron (Fe2) Permease (ZIP) family n=1 Tax=Phytophthora cinnamomi TaxID=4785 RepID=UPI0035594011|nr:Zinc (Zn2)-Iron (Fe2) Permease (ZIP) family [Phytophthora cinnamomi]